MTLTRRCSECGATIRRHRRHKRSKKRMARWHGHFVRGMGRIARESKDPRRPQPQP